MGPGTRVRLVARPEVVGVVLERVGTDSQPRYRVFHGATQIQDYYSDQLEVADADDAGTAVDAATFHAAMSSAQLRHPSTRYLYSLFASRIEFEPYQFRPVLKLIQSDRPRLLIADDVGVGKTIEAGLIMKELQARQDINSVLVICPRPLVVERKWQQELKRFDEDFVHLTSDTLRECLRETACEGIWPRHARKAILPFSLLDERLLLGSGEGQRRRPDGDQVWDAPGGSTVFRKFGDLSRKPPAAGDIDWSLIDSVRREWPSEDFDAGSDLASWHGGNELCASAEIDDDAALDRAVALMCMALRHHLYSDGILTTADLQQTVHNVLALAISRSVEELFPSPAQCRNIRLALTIMREHQWQPASTGVWTVG